MAGAAELLGRGGQQDHAGGGRGQRFHERVFGAGRLRRPGQVMRFVDDEQIPARGDGLLGAARIAGQEGQIGDDELLVLERIARVAGQFDRGAALFVINGKLQIEASQQLDEPLVDQRLGQQYQHALHTARGDQPREDHAGFDGLAESDLVGQQQAHRAAARADLRHAQLMRHQRDAGGGQAEVDAAARAGAAV